MLVIAGARLRPVDGRIAWVSPAEAPDGLRVLLGERDGVQHFAVIVDPSDAPGDRDEWVVLRAIVQSLADEDVADAPLVLHAIGLAEWLWSTRHCPRCGGRLEPRQAGHVLRCTDCGKDQFPRSDPAVIMLVTDGEPGSPEERCLLGRSPAWPAGRYSTLAGFVEPGETMEDAVRREVEEETGVVVGEVSYFGSQPWPLPASLMVGFIGRATADRDRRRRFRDRGRAVVHPRGDARRGRGRPAVAARWRLDLALTHRELVRRTAARALVTRRCDWSSRARTFRVARVGPTATSTSGSRCAGSRWSSSPADAAKAGWEVDVEVVERDGDRDFRGPAVQGKRGERFVYLTWGEVRDGTFSMFRRAKLMLDDVPDPAVETVVARVDLTDECGMPRCARLRLRRSTGADEPWSAQAAVSSASFCLTCAIDGFVCAVPSPYTRVGTVWLPPFADITTSAASGTCSMSTTS